MVPMLSNTAHEANVTCGVFKAIISRHRQLEQQSLHQQSVFTPVSDASSVSGREHVWHSRLEV